METGAESPTTGQTVVVLVILAMFLAYWNQIFALLPPDHLGLLFLLTGSSLLWLAVIQQKQGVRPGGIRISAEHRWSAMVQHLRLLFP